MNASVELPFDFHVATRTVSFRSAGRIHKRHKETAVARVIVQRQFRILPFDLELDLAPALVIARIARAGLHLDVCPVREGFGCQVEDERRVGIVVIELGEVSLLLRRQRRIRTRFEEPILFLPLRDNHIHCGTPFSQSSRRPSHFQPCQGGAAVVDFFPYWGIVQSAEQRTLDSPVLVQIQVPQPESDLTAKVAFLFMLDWSPDWL